jgi:GR25 family glycosyltransferase involved in LPS biosynthesis
MIGCGISHIKLWEKIVSDNIPVSLILEDDAIIKDDIYDFLDKSFDELPDEWDMLFLTSTFIHNQSLVKFNMYKDYIYSPLFINTTSGYFITLNGARNLLKYVNNIYNHIDLQILISNLIHDFKIYSLKNAVVYQTFLHSNNTTITNNYPIFINNYIKNYDIVYHNDNDNYIYLNYIYYLDLFYIRCIDLHINLNVIILFLMGYFNFNLSYILLIYEHSIYHFNNKKLYMSLKILLFGFFCKKLLSIYNKKSNIDLYSDNSSVSSKSSIYYMSSMSSMSSDTDTDDDNDDNNADTYCNHYKNNNMIDYTIFGKFLLI